MRGSERDIPPGTYTATMLLDCDRRGVLLAGQEQGGYLDIEDAWPLVRGGMVHAAVERTTYLGPVAVIREVRLSTTVETKYGPKKFSGQPDLIEVSRVEDDVAYVRVVDYKSTGEIRHEDVAATEEHMMQLNMYAWLVVRELPTWLTHHHVGLNAQTTILLSGRHTVVVEELELFRADMKRTRRYTSLATLSDRGKLLGEKNEWGKWKRFDPPVHEPIVIEPIVHLDPETVGAWVRERIEMKIEGKDNLPPVLPEEKTRMMCPRCPVRQLCGELAESEKESGR